MYISTEEAGKALHKTLMSIMNNMGYIVKPKDYEEITIPYGIYKEFVKYFGKPEQYCVDEFREKLAAILL